MRLTVKITHISKLETLIEDNEFLKVILEPDNYGGWYIDASNNQLIELERFLNKNGIKYKMEWRHL